MSVIALQQKEIRRIQGNLGAERSFWQFSMATTDELVSAQKELVRFLVFDVLKPARARELWKALSDDAMAFSEYDLIAYWDLQINRALRIMEKRDKSE
jgi:hypothetical protein